MSRRSIVASKIELNNEEAFGMSTGRRWSVWTQASKMNAAHQIRRKCTNPLLCTYKYVSKIVVCELLTKTSITKAEHVWYNHEYVNSIIIVLCLEYMHIAQIEFYCYAEILVGVLPIRMRWKWIAKPKCPKGKRKMVRIKRKRKYNWQSSLCKFNRKPILSILISGVCELATMLQFTLTKASVYSFFCWNGRPQFIHLHTHVLYLHMIRI